MFCVYGNRPSAWKVSSYYFAWHDNLFVCVSFVCTTDSVIFFSDTYPRNPPIHCRQCRRQRSCRQYPLLSSRHQAPSGSSEGRSRWPGIFSQLYVTIVYTHINTIILWPYSSSCGKTTLRLLSLVYKSELFENLSRIFSPQSCEFENKLLNFKWYNRSKQEYFRQNSNVP